MKLLPIFKQALARVSGGTYVNVVLYKLTFFSQIWFPVFILLLARSHKPGSLLTGDIRRELLHLSLQHQAKCNILTMEFVLAIRGIKTKNNYYSTIPH